MNHQPKIRVVLADDHCLVRHGICGFLAEDPLIDVIAEADDGDQAVQFIEQYCPDVAVLDLQMPNRTGIEITRWIRERNLPISVLILTAYDDEPYVIAALEAGVNGYILKCADAEDIIHAVHTVAGGGFVLGPQVVPNIMQFLCTSRVHLASLSKREVEILDLAAAGLTNRAIAERLEISHRTVQGHMRRIFERLEVCNRTEAVVKAAQLHLLSLAEHA
jgi:DNA-binding NarL/FixJ family response regulator